MTRFRQSWPWWRWILTGLSTLALVLSAYLGWHYLVGGSMIGCGGESSCDQVLNSRWSAIGGILPVSGLALLSSSYAWIGVVKSDTGTTLQMHDNTGIDGVHTLVLRPLDPGMVFHKVIVDCGGYEQSHLKMPESPYKRQ